MRDIQGTEYIIKLDNQVYELRRRIDGTMKYFGRSKSLISILMMRDWCENNGWKRFKHPNRNIYEDKKWGTYRIRKQFIIDGSGRFLLAGHNLMPNSIMIGGDLDNVACKMAVLNFYIHGVRGSIIHQNTLTGEVFESWRVNNYLYHGLPVPHIELVNPREAYNFIGVNTRKVKSVELSEPVKETVQSTLM